MAKLAFITDNHFDLHSRFDETIRIHQWIAEDAAARGCTGTVLGGDAFERKSCAEERNAFAAWLLQMAKLGPVVGIYGNHEASGDLELCNLIEADHRIHFRDRPGIEFIGDVAIACLPWPRKAHLLAAAGDAGAEEVSNLAQHSLRAVLRGLGAELDQRDGYGRLALAHVMIDGAKTDHDQPIVGADMAVSLADLGLLRASAYACGHVHAQQDDLIDGAPCFYGGSPRHNNFGEPGPKGYVVIDFDGPRLVGWERVATPATPMLLLATHWRDGAMVLDASPASVFGAEIRLRYTTPSDHREAARAAAATLRDTLLASGALGVKLEELPIVTSRARTPEIAVAVTLADKMAALWASQKNAPAVERRSGLLSKISEIEESAA